MGVGAAAFSGGNVPPSTAVKFTACEPLLKFLPTLKLPMKDPEFLNVLAQIRHAFGGESFIWGTG